MSCDRALLPQDADPFASSAICSILFGDKCCYKEPKLEVVHGGWMCCCVHINPGRPCFAPKNSVVIMPFEKSGMCPCDCCKAPNRVTNCDNCFGLCGPPTGDPKIYEFLALQPKNAQAFVDESKKQLVGRKAKAPGAETIDRGAQDV